MKKRSIADQQPTEQHLTRRQVSERLQVSIETLKRWERCGRLTGHRIGPKLIRYNSSDVQKLIAGRSN
jgi:excisionase family DNA binding protein